MQFSNDIYKQVDDALSKRRLNAAKKREEYLAELYAEHSVLKEIDTNIKNVGKQALDILEQSTQTSGVAKNALSKINDLDIERKKYIKETKIKEKTNFFSCKKCNDTGRLDDGYCSCRDEIALKISSDLLGLDEDDLPSFNDFKVDLYDNTRVFRGKSYQKYAELALETAKNFESGNLVINGPTGIGKTFTAECIANNFIKNNKTVFYMSAPRLFMMLEEYKFGQDTSQETKDRINLMHEADLLVIDDLGTEFRTSSGVVDTFLFDLLESRIKTKKSIVLTTNLGPAEIKATYSDRIYSRIIGAFKWINYLGDDLRLKSNY
ncbi:ATP-binding protein [Treponema sp. R6D11]